MRFKVCCCQFVAFLFILGVVSPAPATAQSVVSLAPAEAGGQAPFTLRDGVLVDPARSAIYLMRPGGGIEAVDMTLGNVRWTSEEGARPLFVAGDTLYAQAEAATPGKLTLVALDPDDGGPIGKAMEVDLPEGVHAAIDEGLGRGFELQAYPTRAGAVLRWSAWRAVARGAVEPAVRAIPHFEGEEATVDEAARPSADRAGNHLEGAFFFDLTTRALSAVSPEKLELRPLPPNLSAAERRADLAAATPGEQFVSRDGRTLMISLRTADDRDFEKYLWTLHDRATGAEVGQLSLAWSYAPFFLAGSDLIHVSQPYGLRQDEEWVDHPLSLRAVRLTSGAELWVREVRDTAYRGPFPP